MQQLNLFEPMLRRRQIELGEMIMEDSYQRKRQMVLIWDQVHADGKGPHCGRGVGSNCPRCHNPRLLTLSQLDADYGK